MNKLKQIHEQKGLLQKELAELSGVKLATVQKLDGGINNVNKAQGDTLYKLAKVLEVSMEDLIDVDELQVSKKKGENYGNVYIIFNFIVYISTISNNYIINWCCL